MRLPRRRLLLAASCLPFASYRELAAAETVATVPIFRRTVAVSDSRRLAAALVEAEPGDDIVLASGAYDGPIAMLRHGTAALPIRLRATEPHQARLTDRLLLVGDHNIAQQLTWHDTPTEGDSIVEVTGRHCRVTRCRFVGIGTSKGAQRGIIRIGAPGHCRADYAEVSYNYLEDFAQRGICVNEHDPGSRHVRIFRNHFHTNLLGEGKDGVAIGIGGGAAGHGDVLRELGVIVEHNLLEEIGGGMGNSLQAKCSANVFRFNTIRNNSSRVARIEIRAGRGCRVIGNAVIGSGGPVVLGDDHVILGNFNDGAKSGNWIDMGPMAGNSDLDDADAVAAGAQPAARNCLFVANRGVLRLGSGAQDWAVPAAGTIVESHQGEIVEQHAIDTHYRAATMAVPAYAVLGPQDVGPWAP